MKVGDLVKRKNRDGWIAVEGLAIVTSIKDLKSPHRFVDMDNEGLASINLVVVKFFKSNTTHTFPEHYLELISEA